MSEVTMTVRPFKMGTDKEAALKPLEEASEAHGAAEIVRKCEESEGRICRAVMHPFEPQLDCPLYIDLADEIADTIQAACNLADRYGIDLPAAMERCEKRNRTRGRYERETQVEEDNDGLADSIHDSGERVGVRVDGREGNSGSIAKPDAIAEYHRTLRRMMGEAKCVHDKLVTQAESHAKLKHECRMYRAMLNDAAKEFSLQRANYEYVMTGYRERAAALEDSERLRRELEQERYTYKQNYHDVIHGNEINEGWFNKRGFIELPKGEDGRHIRMGDTVRWGDRGEPFKVRTIRYYPGAVSISDSGGIYVDACHCNHVDDEPGSTTSALDKYDAGLLTRDELVAALRDMS